MKAFYSLCLTLCLFFAAKGQVTIVNYDFNTGGTYAALTPTLAAGVTCAVSSTEPFSTVGGIVTGAGAFTTNATAGNAITMGSSSGTNTKWFQFQLGGASLTNYQSFKIYLQAQRSSTGAQTITIAYSTNGTTFTNFATTQGAATAFSECSFNLSSITAINTPSALYFRVLVSGASGSGTLRIDNFQVQALVACAAPTITSQPSNQSVCTNVSTTFTVATSAATPTYQWEMSANGSTWTNVANNTPTGVTYSGATTPTLSVIGTNAVVQYYYRCTITQTGCSAASNSATLNINTAPSITLQPTNVNTTTSGTGNFIIGVSGTGSTYQWQENIGAGWNNLSNTGVYSGVTTATLSISSPPLSMTGYSYQCVVTNACGTTTTNTGTLSVTTGPCVSESFTNMPANASGYATRTWTGDNGFTWTSTDSRTDQSINGRAITLRTGSLTAAGVSGGIASLTLVTDLPFSDSNGNLQVYVNGVLIGPAAYSTSGTQTITINNINVTGTFTLSIVNTTTNRVSIDNVSWTCYAAPNDITTGTVSAPPFALSSCSSTATGSVSFTSTGTYSVGNTYTAQLSDAGGSFASPVVIGSLSSAANAGTISITIPAGTAAGTGYLIRVISSQPSVTGSSSAAFTITSTCDPCPRMTGALLDACDGSCDEGDNEILFFRTNSEPLTVSPANIKVYYGSSPSLSGSGDNYTESFTTRPAIISNLNTLAGCGTLFYDASASGSIPANTVFMITRSTACFNFDFSGYCASGPIYVLFSTDASWLSTGNFVNSGAVRYFKTDFSGNTAGCVSNYSYDANLLTGGDGASVNWTTSGGAASSYFNNGCTPPTMVLPIDLLDFDATQNDDKNELRWKVSAEHNVRNYLLEKSADGTNFTPLSLVPAYGESSHATVYTTEDEMPYEQLTYYRLKTIETDGAIISHGIVYADRTNKTWKPVVYQQNEVLVVEFKNRVPKGGELRLMDLSGRILHESAITESRTGIDLTDITAGVYVLQIHTAYKTEHIKISIQK